MTTYEIWMVSSNTTSAVLAFILLVLNIWWHVQKK